MYEEIQVNFNFNGRSTKSGRVPKTVSLTFTYETVLCLLVGKIVKTILHHTLKKTFSFDLYHNSELLPYILFRERGSVKHFKAIVRYGIRSFNMKKSTEDKIPIKPFSVKYLNKYCQLEFRHTFCIKTILTNLR